MAPKRPAKEAEAAAAAGSASEGSDWEASAGAARGHGSSLSPSKTSPPANPNPKSTAATHHLRRAMDVLKRELQRKRQLLDADFGGRKLLCRSEIERREMERIWEAERQLLLQKQLRSSYHRRAASRSTPAASDGDASRAEHRGNEEKDALLPREEVIRRLRVLRQSATLFDEDDAARLRRLHAVLEDPAALADVDAAGIGEGQTNDFLRDIQAPRATPLTPGPRVRHGPWATVEPVPARHGPTSPWAVLGPGDRHVGRHGTAR